MKITVADMIKHLQTFPPDMEVWTTWDESGEYWPAAEPQGRIDRVNQVMRRNGKTRWEKSETERNGIPVCILLAPEEPLKLNFEY